TLHAEASVRTSQEGFLISCLIRTAIFLFAALTGREQPLAPPAIGAKVADVAMTDVSGRRRTLIEFKSKKAIVVVFVGTECPIANLYFPTFAEMQKRYANQGVQFLAINSNDQDSFADVVAHARDRKLPFPVVKDVEQQAADAFGARRTPEVFLLDANRIIR